MVSQTLLMASQITDQPLTPAQIAERYINHTSKSVFLTGKAGTGKTTFLKHIVSSTHKRTIIVAPTGIAAINAGGVTIHSQFGLPFGMYVPDDNFRNTNDSLPINTPYTIKKHFRYSGQKQRLLQELELLIIDEVSMLRADILDCIDQALKYARHKPNLPFGGVQILYIGDMMQLPPVVKEEEWNIMQRYYKSQYFFHARTLERDVPIFIELDKIYRQSDSVFIDLLNNLRYNKVSANDILLLNSYVQKDFDPKSALNVVTLTTHNAKADDMNRLSLQELNGKLHTYHAEIANDFPKSMFPLEPELNLKVGAQIMFVKNDTSEHKQFFNGKIGVINSLEKDLISVDFRDGSRTIEVTRHEWQNIRYVHNEESGEIEENVIGTYIQYPIKLAWAITVHKSQGLTFEKAILDVNRAFAPGQVYVALSRLKSLNGLILTQPIVINAIAQDQSLVEHASSKLDTNEALRLLSEESTIYLQRMLLQSFKMQYLKILFSKHEASYPHGDNSNKQKHHGWAVHVLTCIDMFMPFADKFIQELSTLIANGLTSQNSKLAERTKAAGHYFIRQWMDISKQILIHIEMVKEEKSVKIYIEELLELESEVYKHVLIIEKTILLCDEMILGIKSEISKSSSQIDRILTVQGVKLHMPEFDDVFKIPSKRKTKAAKQVKIQKEKKPTTQEITLALLQGGKTPDQAAQERSLTIGTIYEHITNLVLSKKLNYEPYLSESKRNAIMKAYEEHWDGTSITPIKNALGSDYTFGEVRLAIALSGVDEKN